MEDITIAVQHEYTADVWTDVTPDLRAEAPVVCDYGLPGVGPLDLVADTGSLNYVLDNSEGNSEAKLGLYTPGHANAKAGFDEGMRSRVRFSYGGTDYYKMLTWLADPDIAAGIYGPRRVAVDCVDWMDHAASQRIDKLAIVTSKRIDQAIPLVLADMPVQPRATSLATGVEVFGRVFDSDNDQQMSPMSLLLKLARNEYGLIYMRGDTVGGGTLRCDNRHTRALNLTSILTLNEQEGLDIEYSRRNVYNFVHAKMYPKRVDAAATTVLFTNQVTFSIGAGQSVTITCPYRDPTTSQPISASDVVNPPTADTDFKFGSSPGTASDLNASLGIAFVKADGSAGIPGSNSSRLKLTNNASVTGYVNLLQLRGKGIYAYDPQTLDSRNEVSILKRGPLELTIDLEQHDSAVRAQSFADYVRSKYGLPQKMPTRVRVLANKSAGRAAGVLQAEVSSRITLGEAVTAVSGDYFVNRVRLEAQPLGGGKVALWAEFAVAPAASQALFIWDTSRWDVDAYWAF